MSNPPRLSPFFLAPRCHRRHRRRSRGVALIIVLAFVALLTGVLVAFLSRSISDRQISNSSANDTRTRLLVDGAVDTLISDLKQEIADPANSTVTKVGVAPNTATIYTPKTPANAVPALVGANAATGTENLVKRSVRGQPFYPNSTTTRAAEVSTLAPSLNGRYISPARWNKPLLLSKANPSLDTDLTPIGATAASGGTAATWANAPDWALVTRDGSVPTTWSTNLVAGPNKATAVVGRYAYQLYDEGGLLDANAAGYPSTAPASNSPAVNLNAYKGSLAMADLTQIPGISDLTASRRNAFRDTLVGWRNYATAQPSSNFPGYAFSPAQAANYLTFAANHPRGFLAAGNATLFNSQSDRLFGSRQELLKLLLGGFASQGTTATGKTERANIQNALPYLTHYSRDLNQPSFTPVAGRPTVLGPSSGGNNANGLDDQINPGYLAVRVPTTKAGGRNDGSALTVGEPLVKKRFNLNRLAWITWEGPSSTASSATKNSLLNAGVSQAVVDAGTPANIQKYFGLNWLNGSWKYNLHNAGSSPGKGPIMRLGRPPGVTTPDSKTYVQDAGREPDFFELLKASINVGSLGKAAVSSNTAVGSAPTGYTAPQVPANFRYGRDVSVDYQILQIGANIIDQFDFDSFPTRIGFEDGSQPATEFAGVEDLPYLSYFVNGMLRGEAPTKDPQQPFGGTRQYPPPDAAPLMGSPGSGVALQVPALWNPHDVNGSKGSPRPTRFRIVADSADPVTVAAAAGGYTKIYTGSVAQERFNNQDYFIFSYNATSTSPQPVNAQYSVSYTKNGRVLDESNTALTFSDSLNGVNGVLFREPTLLLRQGGDINLQSATYPSGIKSIDLNPVPNASDAIGTPFLGIVLGTFPLRFDAVGADGLTTKTFSAGAGFVGPGGVASQPLIYLTYRVQYQDSNGGWITYDTKYGRVSTGRYDFNWNLSSSNSNAPTIAATPDAFIPTSWAAAPDPRSSRFGLFFGALAQGVSNPMPVSPAGYGWIADSQGSNDPKKGVSFTLRADNYGGSYFVDFNTQVPGNGNSFGLGSTDDPVFDAPFPQYQAGWTTSLVQGYQNSRYSFSLGMLSQNNSSAPFLIRVNAADNPSPSNDEFGKTTGNPQPAYYGDADGVIRRAMGAYVPPGTSGSLASAASPIGLPMAITQKSTAVNPAIVSDPTKDFNQAQSRPLMLNRPFRSVGELGYVFRDTPWKNLDFFTPESGDAALLDVFCTSDADDPNGLVAGRVNLNTRQTAVLSAIISNAYIDDPKVANVTVGTLSSSAPTAIGAALVARTADITTSGYGPLQNISDLVGRWSGTSQPVVPPTTYVPTNPPTSSTHKGDLTLDNGYKDGKLSYVGFSGNVALTSPPKDLSSAYATATFSTSSPANNTSLRLGMNQIQRFHEAPIRALANSGQTRVWNLMIDLVAQTGRYPSNASALNNFVVEGEQRYWVHVAIDRYTGAVVDRQIEVVRE